MYSDIDFHLMRVAQAKADMKQALKEVKKARKLTKKVKHYDKHK